MKKQVSNAMNMDHTLEIIWGTLPEETGLGGGRFLHTSNLNSYLRHCRILGSIFVTKLNQKHLSELLKVGLSQCKNIKWKIKYGIASNWNER